ncbi:hypothetical protein CY34DRAFT_25364 [Suillus luteus UH-Slu-Lm8-n1]|uniref:BTB domain-containing protein n=1 Tax=Suillus luteus UH-Slu-Lm8-n1 TaxID=930992 RepID=A0A0D0ABQ7_9AGAM|nr:hypothetical protein CY34DRAFT_25364 [Suillus luteus UH-Slu-Lm8-n1]
MATLANHLTGRDSDISSNSESVLLASGAGNSLFRVHASILGDKSLAFQDMFAASQGTKLEQVDGSTDDKPICVPLQVSESAFELFLSVCYNKPDVLKICNKAVIQLLKLSDMYLCKDAGIKERLDVHCWIIACEAPPMVHVGTCTRQKSYKDDWKQLWWNGIGRFLLDGRNPQPYKDAIECFKKLDIREINLDCWKAVLYIVKACSAFNHQRKLITCTADDLVNYLFVKPNFEDFGCLVH